MDTRQLACPIMWVSSRQAAIRSYRGKVGALKVLFAPSRHWTRFMTYTAEPVWGNTVDVDNIAFDGLATHEITNGTKQSGRNGGKRRGAE